MILQSRDVTRFISVCLPTMVTRGHNKIEAKNDKRTEIKKVFLSCLYSTYTVQISPKTSASYCWKIFQKAKHKKYLHFWTSLLEIYKLNI